jgi:hypothetical protein
MDPITLILAALAAGAASGAKDTAADAIRDAYGALKGLVHRKLQGDPAKELVLEQHEKDPEVWKEPLKKALTDSGADQDQAILEHAQSVLDQIPPGSEVANYVNNIYGGQVVGWVQGKGNTVTINNPGGPAGG